MNLLALTAVLFAIGSPPGDGDPGDAELAKQMYGAIDMDKSSSLSKEEAEGLLANMVGNVFAGKQHTSYDEFFAKLDSDSNGQLEWPEAEALFTDIITDSRKSRTLGIQNGGVNNQKEKAELEQFRGLMMGGGGGSGGGCGS